MKRKIVNMGTIGIVVIILLVGVLNYKQAAETKMKKIETVCLWSGYCDHKFNCFLCSLKRYGE